MMPGWSALRDAACAQLTQALEHKLVVVGGFGQHPSTAQAEFATQSSLQLGVGAQGVMDLHFYESGLTRLVKQPGDHRARLADALGDRSLVQLLFVVPHGDLRQQFKALIFHTHPHCFSCSILLNGVRDVYA